MKRLPGICAFAVAAASFFLAASCRDVFTSSLGVPLERDGPPRSSSSSVSTLVDIAHNDQWASDPDTAATVLDLLALKDQAILQALPVDDQAAILNLAANAAIGMGTLATLADSAVQSGANVNDLVSQALLAFDATVNLTVIESLLGNPSTLDAAPAASLAMSAAVLIADVADDIGVTDVMEIMAGAALGGYALTPAQTDKLTLALGVVTELDGRPGDEGSVTLGDFDLLDLLRGIQ